MAALTLTQMLTEIRARAKHANTTFISDDNLTTRLNVALKKLGEVAQLRPYEGWTASTVADQNYYDKPDNAYVIEYLVIDDEYYYPITFQQFLQGMASGNEFTVNGDTVFIYPTPTASGSSDISMYGIKFPDELSSGTDTSELGERYDEALINYALYACYEIRDTPDSLQRAQYFLALFEKERQQLASDKNSQNANVNETVESTW